MKQEFTTLLLGLLGEHNEQLAQLIRLATSDDLMDEENEEPDQDAIEDGDLIRTRTAITKRISCVVHFSKANGTIKYGALVDLETGERMEFSS